MDCTHGEERDWMHTRVAQTSSPIVGEPPCGPSKNCTQDADDNCQNTDDDVYFIIRRDSSGQ